MMKYENEWPLVLPQFTVNRNSPSLDKAPIKLIARTFTVFSTLFYYALIIHPLLRWSVWCITASSMLMMVYPAWRALIYFEAASYLYSLQRSSL